MATPAQQFPPLPAPPQGRIWPAAVRDGHKFILSTYIGSRQLLRLEDGDPIRLRLHSDRISQRVMPVAVQLSAAIQDQRWSQLCMAALTALVGDLDQAAEGVNMRHQEQLHKPAVVTAVKTGKPGRPTLVIDPDILREGTSSDRHITLTQFAKALGVNPRTLCRRLAENHIPTPRTYTDITDDELDELLGAWKELHPRSGWRYALGFLSAEGLRVQQDRVKASLKRIDGLPQALRVHARIVRQVYVVPFPNYLWHIDGHHKLIRWGIVIHGGVDGYDRLLLMLQASTNNLASTVLELFLKAVEVHGAPSRVRGDRGGENMEVAVWMIKHRGPNRASFMWGSSTRNVRIERMWLEVGTQFAIYWRAFFTRLENRHHLNPENPSHLWLLHLLFLDDINKSCMRFQQDWNRHPISGAGRNQTPADMRFLSDLTQGTLAGDDFNDVDPDVLSRHYGTEGRARRLRPGQTGAGHYDEDTEEGDDPSSSESGSSSEPTSSDSDSRLARDQAHHVRHPPIEVPGSNCPFSDDQLETFLETLLEVHEEEVIPAGYGVRMEEWDDEDYGEVETLKRGRGGREDPVELPFAEWWPRAVYWAQGLDIMSRMLLDNDEEYAG